MKLASEQRHSFFKHLLDAGEATILYKKAVVNLEQAEKAKQSINQYPKINSDFQNAIILEDHPLQELISTLQQNLYGKCSQVLAQINLCSLKTYQTNAQLYLYEAAEKGLAIAAAKLADFYLNLAGSSSEAEDYLARAIYTLQLGASSPKNKFNNFEQKEWVEYCQRKLLELKEVKSLSPAMQYS